MLHRKAVPAGALDLLRRLCIHPVMEDFALAGGTSLALRFGHRISVDLDFFRTDKFDTRLLAAALAADFSPFSLTNENSSGMTAFVEEVKADFVAYPYPLLAPPETIGEARMMSLPDVVAMKLAAVSNRGAKKDFYDLHMLLSELGFDELLRCYRRKFPNHDPLIPIRSMIFFDDAEDTEAPRSLISTTWERVKSDIRKAVAPAL